MYRKTQKKEEQIPSSNDEQNTPLETIPSETSIVREDVVLVDNQQEQLEVEETKDQPSQTTEKKDDLGETIDDYFLGGLSIPWWALATSGMASNLDISGTMINIAMIYAMGVRGMFIELRGGMTMALAFMMAFLGKWFRRAGVMTSAEWMYLRFGHGREGNLARLSTAIAFILLAIGSITYFSVGSGKFVAEFVPGLGDFLGIKREFWASFIMVVLSMIYTVTTGLSGVVWTDVFQALIIFVSIITVCIMSLVTVDLPSVVTLSAPIITNQTMISYQTYNASISDWSLAVPKWSFDFPENSTYSIYNLFGLSIMFYVVKMFIEGFGGVTSYAEQRYFAANNERDATILTSLWIFFLSFRWPFIVAVALMGIYYGNGYGKEVIADPEIVLPRVISDMVPMGLKGILLGGMISAAMSTFDSTVNQVGAVFVKDVYHAFLRKNASQRELLIVGRVTAVVIVTIGLGFTLVIKSINDIWGWITMSLGSGLTVPLLLRWYWHRINGYGYSFGLLLGSFSAIIMKTFFTIFHYDMPEYYSFCIIAAASFVFTIIISLLTPRTDPEVLLKFYAKTRPFGLWGPIRKRFTRETVKKVNVESIFDWMSLIVIIPWQVFQYLFWMSIVMKSWITFGVSISIVVITTVALYFVWYRNIAKGERYYPTCNDKEDQTIVTDTINKHR
ncbi:hypothetical protein ABK040_007245 [Willaertia magna]